jgi:hypothetical protein
MSISNLQITFWVGLALVLVGLLLVLFNFSGDGPNRFKGGGFEMEIRGPAFVVMLIGAGLMWFSISKSSESPIDPHRLRPASPPVSPEPPAAHTAERGFGVVLIASSVPSVANQQATKAKQLAPANSDVILYLRKSLWAVVIHYADSLKAQDDLSRYT